VAWTELFRLSRKQVLGSCHHGNKPLDSINGGTFYD